MTHSSVKPERAEKESCAREKRDTFFFSLPFFYSISTLCYFKVLRPAGIQSLVAISRPPLRKDIRLCVVCLYTWCRSQTASSTLPSHTQGSPLLRVLSFSGGQQVGSVLARRTHAPTFPAFAENKSSARMEYKRLAARRRNARGPRKWERKSPDRGDGHARFKKCGPRSGGDCGSPF